MAEMAIIVPVYGQEHLTINLVNQIDKQNVWYIYDLWIVDNKGDLAEHLDARQRSISKIITPGENIGWLRGNLLGYEKSSQFIDYNAYMFINNDVVISPSFLRNMAQAMYIHEPSILAPLYDDIWPNQKSNYLGPAKSFQPSHKVRSVDFVDGTCMLISKDCIKKTGLFDEENFGERGWGADLDICYRVRNAGDIVMVTHMAYLNHIRAQTVYSLNQPDWLDKASSEMNEGLSKKWGKDWARKIGLP
jgi:GT2 family glycosyltransferase